MSKESTKISLGDATADQEFEKCENNLALEKYEDFCVYCPVTGQWCKVRNYRSCEQLAKWYANKGIDVFSQGIALPDKPKQKVEAIPIRRGR